MNGYVTDTHALIWFMQDSKKLGAKASLAFSEAEQGLAYIFVPTICLVELVFLEERGRLPGGTADLVHQALASESNGLVAAPLTADVAKTLSTLSRAEIPELPDRVIAATAAQHRLPLLTNDHLIQASTVETVW